MRPMRKALAALMSVFMLSLLGVGVSAAPASAAPGCYGYSCHGYDLYHFGCSYTSTTAANAFSGNTKLATVYNRYSAGCNSNWAEAILTPAAINAGDKMAISVSTDRDSMGTSEEMDAPGPSNTGALMEGWYANVFYSGSASAYSDMVDGTNLTWASVAVYDRNGNPIASNYIAQ
jgi:hypothetical protein